MTDDSAAWRGRIIDDRYEVVEVIGRGGMGVVLRARHTFTGAAVALKVLRRELSHDAELQRRFLAEARAGNTIGHPGIVQIFDAGRDRDDELYLAMELLEGESLRAPILRGQLRAADVARIGAELLAALGAAHAHGFIHRDLKPENVYVLAGSGAVKLLDFGIAKVIAAKPSTIGATAAGVLLGTVAYMAPEQLEDARAVDPRADLWAVGVMLYELLSGRLPFDAYTPQALFVAVATSEPVSIQVPMPSAPPAVVAFFARALARDPQRRFGSAEEMAAAFAALPLGMTAAAPGRALPPAAPSQLASGFAPPAAAPPAVAPSASAVPAASRGALWLGAAVVVAIAAVVIAYVATRPAPRDAAAVPIDAPAPRTAPTVAVAPPPADAAPAVNAAPVVADAAAALVTPPSVDAAALVTAPPVDAAAASPTAACANACDGLQTCNEVDSRARCLATCASTPSFATCVNAPNAYCPVITQCWFTATCGGGPRGTAGCGDTLRCVDRCAGDTTCECACIAKAKPGNEWVLGEAYACTRRCAGKPASCLTDTCPFRESCMGT